MHSGRGFLGAGGPVALAHRGSAVHPENSLAAFTDAVDLGYRFLETDVRTTADGVLVALHDADLARTTDATGPLAALPWERVSRLRLRAPVSTSTGTTSTTGELTDHHPLRLVDLLEAWPDAVPRVRLNVDVKDAAAVPALVELLSSASSRGRGPGGDAARVCVASFCDARRRAVVAGLAERGVTATSSAGTAGVVRFLVGARAGLRGRALRALVGADALQVPQAQHGVRVVTRRLVAAAHSAGLAVHVWTVDDPAEVRRLLDLGVDGIVTDDAVALRAVLTERGAWPTPVQEDP